MAVPTSTIAMPDPRIRELIADREKLTATKRQRFFAILDRHGAFRPTGSRRGWRTLLLLSLGISLASFWLDGERHWLGDMAWPWGFLLSLIPIWRLRRHERSFHPVDFDGEWHAYCLFLRPAIMAKFPGLLDRNLVAPSPPPNRFVPRPSSLLLEILVTKGPDFWGAALGGIWLGTVAILLCRFFQRDPSHILSLLLPAAGFLVGPAIWALSQAIVYSIAQKETEDI